MNTERLTVLAEWLEGGMPHVDLEGPLPEFNLLTSIKFNVFDEDDAHRTASCGTICCIAGATVQFFDDDFEDFVAMGIRNHYIEGAADSDEYSWGPVSDRARGLLELDSVDAKALFMPGGIGTSMLGYNDAAWAARTIRYLILTGKVDWEFTRPKGH